MIDRFDGEYRFLSNFWPYVGTKANGGYVEEAPVELKGRVFPTAEHAYQACKTSHPDWQRDIQAAHTPHEAKALGSKAPLREGWDDMKVRIMVAIIQSKFAPTTPLAHKLMLTGGQQLVEGNTWGDRFWGCELEPAGGPGTWVGRNELGRILMEHRRWLQGEIPFGPVGS